MISALKELFSLDGSFGTLVDAIVSPVLFVACTLGTALAGMLPYYLLSWSLSICIVCGVIWFAV